MRLSWSVVLSALAAVALTACDTATESPSSVQTAIAPIATDSNIDTDAATTTTREPMPPIVEDGCAIFNGAELGELTRMPVPLAIITTASSDYQLYCALIGVANGRDASTVIVVEPLSEQSPGYFRDAGDLETEIEVAGLPGVDTGRGSLRAQLDESLGLTLTVGLRALRSEITPYTDREHLDIRDAVADYVVAQLAEETS